MDTLMDELMNKLMDEWMKMGVQMEKWIYGYI